MRLLTKIIVTVLALSLSVPFVTVSAENEVGTVYALDFKKITDSSQVYSFARSDDADLSKICFFEEYIEGGININSNSECDGLSLDGENVDFYFLKRNRKELCVEGHTNKRNLIVFSAPVPGRYLYNLELHPWYSPERARVDIIVGNEKNGYKIVKTHKYVSTTASLRTSAIDVGEGENVYFSFYGVDDYVPFALTRLDLKLLKMYEISDTKDADNGIDPSMIGGLVAIFAAVSISITTVITASLKKRKQK